MRLLRLALVTAVAFALLPSASAAAAGNARASYASALERERALTGPGKPTPPIAELRKLAARFERVTYLYPTSGLADDALQKAAQIVEKIHARTKADADRARAKRLWEWLAREYPASRYAREARASAQALEPRAAAATKTPPPTPRVDPPVARVAPPVASLPSTKAETQAVAGAPQTPPPGMAPSTPAPSTPTLLREVRRAVLPEVVRITLELDGEVGYRHERLDGPARLFFDLNGVVAAPHLRDTVLSWSDDVVRKVRLGRPESGTTRVVLDLEGTRRYSVFTLYNPYRLVVDLERADGRVTGLRPSAPPPSSVTREPGADSADVSLVAAVASAATAAGAAAAATPESAALLADIDLEPAPEAPPVDPREIDGRDQTLTEEVQLASRPVTGGSAVAPVALPPPPAPAAAASPKAPAKGRPASPSSSPPLAPKPPSANSSGGFSLSRQLGLGVSRIVIDPGHGGRDPGALGKGVSEAELVLDIALRLEKLLARQPGVEVVLTRRTDAYVPLEERTAIANREQADLFLSIHANASRNVQARGVETYFLNFATSPEAEAVAARENSASERRMHNLNDIVKAIATNNKVHESRDFATLVQDSMVRRLAGQNREIRNLGVKQAPFVVLIGAAMPSVLAEISFVTNPREAQLLRSGSYRQRIAEALQDAVVKYQRSLKAVGTVAEQ